MSFSGIFMREFITAILRGILCEYLHREFTHISEADHYVGAKKNMHIKVYVAALAGAKRRLVSQLLKER